MEERRSSIQLIVSVSSILSVIVGSIGLITFVQTSERRITTMEVRIDYLRESIEALKGEVIRLPKK